MPTTVDTRFFLTHYLADTEELKAKTSRKMIELLRETTFVPTIVIHETYKFMFAILGKDVAELRVNSILTSGFRIVDLTTKIALTSAVLRCRYSGLPTADSIVAATCIESRSKRVLSDDSHFKKIDGIHSEWL
jgi:predicted nucleic acid-binding protein